MCLPDLMDSKENWINDETTTDIDSTTTKENNDENVLANSEVKEKDENTPFGINPEKYSSVSKLLRVTAWCLRFIKTLKNKVKRNLLALMN